MGGGIPNIIHNVEDLSLENIHEAEATNSMAAGGEMAFRPITPKRTAEHEARLLAQAPVMPTRTKSKERRAGN